MVTGHEVLGKSGTDTLFGASGLS